MEQDGFTTNAQLTTTLPLDGEYRVVVMSFGYEARGSYVLTVTDVSELEGDHRTVTNVVDTWAQSGGECAIVRCAE